MDGGNRPFSPIVKLAALLIAVGVTRTGADTPGQASSPVPSDWRIGIATFYGGAPDHMVCLLLSSPYGMFPASNTSTYQHPQSVYHLSVCRICHLY